ncbi:MAG: site-2 protease family protein [Clostridia bacterium]|nr:site-2 protease family protein [Clostridia bacterium]
MRIEQLFTNPLVFILDILYLLPAILIGLSFHEAAHAYVAYKMGDSTAKNLGRLTLDPAKHIDPIGLLCLLLVGFGWAKPVPVNPNNYKNRREGEFLVSVAGVSMNFILGFFFTIVLALLYVFGWNNAIAVRIVSTIITINFSLMVFNLLPIGPLDGMGIIKSIFWKSSYKIDMFILKYNQIITVVLIVLLVTGVIGYIISGVVIAVQSSVHNLVFTIFGLI